MKLTRQIRRKLWLVTATAVLVAIVAGVFIWKHAYPGWADRRLRVHDTAQTNHEMTAAYNLLTPLLNSLSMQLSPQQPATCEPGDPSLYAHSCGTQSTAKYTGDISTPQDADAIAQKLQAVDTTLKNNGWALGGNDFRRQRKRPSSAWPDMLSTYGVTIEYRKGTCDMNAYIIQAVIYNQYRVAYPGYLGCYIDDGPATE